MKFSKLNNKQVKYLVISIISIFLLYLFYLSIPSIYNVSKVHGELKKLIKTEFGISLKFSPKDIDYSIFPYPNYRINKSKISLKKNGQDIELGEINKIKIFIGQGNLFQQKKIFIKNIVLENLNLYVNNENYKVIDIFLKNKKNKRISFDKSIFFIQNNVKDTLAILTIKNSSILYDKKTSSNILKVNGKIFNLPFKYTSHINFYKKEIVSNLKIKKINLNLKNISNYENFYNAKNELNFFRSKFLSEIDYNLKNKKLKINSLNSDTEKIKLKYNLVFELNPFEFNFNLFAEDFNFKNFFVENNLLEQIVKNFFTNNTILNGKIFFSSNSAVKNKLFESVILKTNFKDGIIDFNKSIFKMKKIGLINIKNSQLDNVDNELIFSGDLFLNIDSSKEFYKLFLISKKNRVDLSQISFKLIYNLTTNNFIINELKINNSINKSFYENDNNINSWIRLRNFVMEVFDN